MPAKATYPWAESVEELSLELEVDPERGLTDEQVSTRRERYGPNRLRELLPVSAWSILGKQLVSWVVALLFCAAVVSFAFGELLEGVAILAVLGLNTAIGFFTELRAMRSMEALRQIGSVRARVLRAGDEAMLPAVELVPGDILVFDAGDVVSADVRLCEAAELEVDESALTGESVPVSKSCAPVPQSTLLAERTSMLFKGTAVTRGNAIGVVVATGMSTELGRIALLVQEARKESTPLEKQLDALGRKLIWAVIGIAAITSVAGILAGKPVVLMIETGVALAVAAIPEGLPVVATLALARGMWRMARRSVLINRLSAVETLGATTVIFTDKTGTLTENRMQVLCLVIGGERVDVDSSGEPRLLLNGRPLNLDASTTLAPAIEIVVLCNNATLGEERDDDLGDPTELALLRLGRQFGIERESLSDTFPEVREDAFDSESMMMATVHKTDSGHRIAVKGAAEAVLAVCTHQLDLDGERTPLTESGRNSWNAQCETLACDGLRVLGIAERTADNEDAEPYADLTLVGLVAMADPPRAEVRAALAACHGAGIDVVMVTGDHSSTASAIARAVGLVTERDTAVCMGADIDADHVQPEVHVYSRMAPEQKLDLIAAYQRVGHVVAMTGDGVNDAPALRKADIGVAMGKRGTQVAREAADMVLVDDAFESIVAAVEQGRVIFDNIRKVVFYLLSCNVSEVLVVTLAALVGGTLPILPLQILFLNLVTDVFPALALAFGGGDRKILSRPPRDPSEPVLVRGHWLGIVSYSLVISLCVLTALMLAEEWLGYSRESSITVSFLTLATAQLLHVFNARARGTHPLRNEVVMNPWVWGSLALGGLLLVASVYLPGLNHALQTSPPGPAGWALVLGLSSVPLLLGQVYLAFSKRQI